MNYLMQLLSRLVDCKSGASVDERYLAQSVDAQQFELRAQALERMRA